MDSIGARIRAVREERGIEAKELARRVGLAYSTLKDLENEHQKSTTKLHNVASVLGVSVKWLETGKGKRDPEPGDTEAAFEDVEAYPQAVGLGTGREAIEYAETHRLKFRSASLRRKGLIAENLRVYYGDGDSMEPRIRDGDAILFDESDRAVVDDAIYVVLWNGEYYAKRSEVLDDGSVLFRSDNPSGDHQWRKARRMNDRKSPIEIVGRVRWIGSWED